VNASLSPAARLGRCVLCAPVLASCVQVLGIPGDPELVPTGPWRCLNKPPATQQQAPVAAQAQVLVQACDFITDCTTTVTGLMARLCDKRDVGCINPRLTGLTDVNGEFSFQVPTAGSGFDGYLLVTSNVASCTDATAFGSVAGPVLCGAVAPNCNVTAPDEQCMLPIYASALFFFNPPIVRDVMQPLPLQLFPSTGLPSIIQAAGIPLNPTAGNLFIQALDCDGDPAADVRYAVEQDAGQMSPPYYVNNGVISSSFTRTDSTGIGGFVGVPPGFVSVLGVNGDSVPVGVIGVQAVPSMLTYSVLLPPH
jgi:hypothetical protein